MKYSKLHHSITSGFSVIAPFSAKPLFVTHPIYSTLKPSLTEMDFIGGVTIAENVAITEKPDVMEWYRVLYFIAAISGYFLVPDYVYPSTQEIFVQSPA